MQILVNDQPIKVREVISGVNFKNNPLVDQVLYHRGVRSPLELDYRLERLLPADGLSQLPAALEVLTEALNKQQKIVIVGDFDSDGMTSTALAVMGLKDLGFSEVNYFIPNRFEHGYGLSPKVVDLVFERFHPDIIITVDNGIVSFDGVKAAKAKGLKVIITDHHLSSGQLPPADSVINPNQPGDNFQSKHLTGVGVALYLLLALRKKLRQLGHFNGSAGPNLAQYLDLVAIGTMADAAVLDYNNRLLVQEGLRRIRTKKTRLGILALLELARRKPQSLTSEDLVFVIAPRLNAAGRLSDANLAVELLTTLRQPRAQHLAFQIDRLNSDRKIISGAVESEAQELALQLRRAGGEQASWPGMVLYKAGWNQGVSGIVASRLKERFNLPVLVFADSKDGQLKGSGRSVEGIDMYQSFAKLAAKEPGLISFYGGHAMAAGISLPLASLKRFSVLWAKELEGMQSGAASAKDPQQAVIEVDNYLKPEYLNLENAKLLKSLGPWGNGFEEPTFLGKFNVEQVDRLVSNHFKLKLKLDSYEPRFEGVIFNASTLDQERLKPKASAKMLFKLFISYYGNQEALQLLVTKVL